MYQVAPRLNRIPRPQRSACNWCRRLHLAFQRWQTAGRLIALEREIAALQQHRDHDELLTESLRREYKRSPTLAARISADSLVMHGLVYDRCNLQAELAALSQP